MGTFQQSPLDQPFSTIIKHSPPLLLGSYSPCLVDMLVHILSVHSHGAMGIRELLVTPEMSLDNLCWWFMVQLINLMVAIPTWPNESWFPPTKPRIQCLISCSMETRIKLSPSQLLVLQDKPVSSQWTNQTISFSSLWTNWLAVHSRINQLWTTYFTTENHSISPSFRSSATTHSFSKALGHVRKALATREAWDRGLGRFRGVAGVGRGVFSGVLEPQWCFIWITS